MGRVNQVATVRTVTPATGGDPKKPQQKQNKDKGTKTARPDLAGMRKRLQITMASKAGNTAQTKSMKRLLTALNVAVRDAEEKDAGTVRAKKRRQRRQRIAMAASAAVIPINGGVPEELAMQKGMVQNILYRAGIHRSQPSARGALQQVYVKFMSCLHRHIVALGEYHGRGMLASSETYKYILPLMGLHYYDAPSTSVRRQQQQQQQRRHQKSSGTASSATAGAVNDRESSVA